MAALPSLLPPPNRRRWPARNGLGDHGRTDRRRRKSVDGFFFKAPTLP